MLVEHFKRRQEEQEAAKNGGKAPRERMRPPVVDGEVHGADPRMQELSGPKYLRERVQAEQNPELQQQREARVRELEAKRQAHLQAIEQNAKSGRAVDLRGVMFGNRKR